VAIYRLLREAAFGPEEITRVVTAYETALKRLGLTDRQDPVTELIANQIIQEARNGATEPKQIAAAAIKALGIPDRR
jgi:hypothetical protein